MLRKHVDRVLRHGGRLDVPPVHPLHDDGGLEQVATVLGEHLGLGRDPDLVARTAHPLEPPCDGRRGLDEHDEIDGRHVDAELEGRGRHHALELATLEAVLDVDPLLSRHRAVMRLDDVVVGEPVELGGEALCEPAAVHEEDRAAVREDEIEQLRVHGGPDRPAPGIDRAWIDGICVDGVVIVRAGVGPHSCAEARFGPRHVGDGDHDLDVECRLAAGVDDRDRPRPPGVTVGFPSAEERRDVLERALCRRQPDALDVASGDRVEALEAQREV